MCQIYLPEDTVNQCVKFIYQQTVNQCVKFTYQKTQSTNVSKLSTKRHNQPIRSRKSQDRLHNDQKIKDKRTNNDVQNTTYKTKDRVTRKV